MIDFKVIERGENMGEKPIRLRELYGGWKTEDLKKAITIDKAEYETETINIINEELQSRNVTKEDLDSFYQSYSHEGESLRESLRSEGKLFCPKCHSLNIRNERPWWTYFMVGLYMLFIRKYQCYDCGYSFRKIKEKNE